jgi:hypothetical protein
MLGGFVMNKVFKMVSYCMMTGLLACLIGGPILAHGPGQGPKDIVQHVTQSLKNLVSNGTITQEQSEQVLSFLKEKEAERQADFDKTKDMSPEERKAYFDQHRPKCKPDIVNDLMINAGLSEDQAKTVADAIRPPQPPTSEPPQR